MLLNYSPSSSDPELLLRCTAGASRLHLLETLTDAVAAEIGRKTHQHQILIGPRGSGKTHILKLLVHRLCTSDAVNKRVLAVQLPEEITAVHPSDMLARIIHSLGFTLEQDACGLGDRASAISRLCRARGERLQREKDDKEALNVRVR